MTAYAGRLQTQEVLTNQIAWAVYQRAQAVRVRIVSRHTCSLVRGVRQRDMEMKTEAVIGKFN